MKMELVELLGVSRVQGTQQILLHRLLNSKALQLNHHYSCSCGKAILLLPLCVLECSKLEIAELETKGPCGWTSPMRPSRWDFASRLAWPST